MELRLTLSDLEELGNVGGSSFGFVDEFADLEIPPAEENGHSDIE